MRKKPLFLTRPPRWKKRLLYFFAFFGALAFSGLTFIVYLAMQVPEDQLTDTIPFPKFANILDKPEPIPDVKKSAAEKAPVLGEIPAYALFYNDKPVGEESAKLRSPRTRNRAKPAKRTQSVKAKGSS